MSWAITSFSALASRRRSRTSSDVAAHRFFSVSELNQAIAELVAAA